MAAAKSSKLAVNSHTAEGERHQLTTRLPVECVAGFDDTVNPMKAKGTIRAIRSSRVD
jgi:hypothetical protein